MRIRSTMFSLSPLLLPNFALPESSLEIAGLGRTRPSVTNDHLDFPRFGGFGKAFQDAAGKFLSDSLQPDQGPTLPSMKQQSSKNKGDSR